MRLLVLDDDPIRHAVFERRCADGDEVVSVYTVSAALHALRLAYYDQASLDHDLGAGPDGQTFVARMLTEIPPERWPGKITVHSGNPVGGLRMTERLRDAGIPSQYAPFKP